MYTLYIANRNYSSWSLRPWLLLDSLAIPFEEALQVFGPGSNRAAFQAFSPAGTVPCLVDGDVTVWESLAIVEYLAERHAGVWPASPLARAWARSAASEMHAGFSALRGICPMNCGIRVRLHEVPAALAADLARIEALWLDGLDRFGGPWLGGAGFTAVDAFFAPVAFRVQSYGLALGARADGYVRQLLALPGMVRWYALALAEPWREPQHEAEAAAVGVIERDLRLQARSETP
ncbi:MAG: glutathione S-transferase family protein [Gammaproteobacteria bacterium]